MQYYSKIKMPKNMQEGLANFVQMIINELEQGNSQEALYKAVDLLDDINSGAYHDGNMLLQPVKNEFVEVDFDDGRVVPANEEILKQNYYNNSYWI